MADDNSVQLIETIRVEPGRHLPLLDGHLQRLTASCRALQYAEPGRALTLALHQCVEKLDGDGAHRLRLLVSRDGTFTLTASPLPFTAQPVRLALHATPSQADPFWLQHKTTHRPWYDEAARWLAEHPDYFDVAFCNQQNHVQEASRSNLYIQDHTGLWLTPPLTCGLLPGVQRQALLDRGLVRAALITRDDLLAAPAVRVSNALRGWLDATLA